MMNTKIATRLEMFVLDLFIYVLSETKAVRFIIQVGYKLLHDRRFLMEFAFVCFVSCCVGLGLGYWISFAAEKIF